MIPHVRNLDLGKSRPVIIVGTGRCGSTLLSQIIRRHDDLLSVSEVFSFVSDLGMRIDRAFPQDRLSGLDFWKQLSSPQPRQSLLLTHDLQMPEVIYPWERGRFEPHELPPILQAMLPHLDMLDPDGLFDRLAAEVAGWPPAPVGVQYKRLFNTLARWFEKTQWVERSGGSLRVVNELRETFPDAAFIHLVRDGRDTALSMSRHFGFRMALLCGLQAEQLGVDPYESTDRTDEADLSDELADTLPEHFTSEAFHRFDLPPSMCGHYWSGEIVAGLEALKTVPADSLLTIHFEELVADPATQLGRLAELIGVPASSEWLRDAQALVRPTPPRWTRLSAKQQADLTNACQPGFAALDAFGLAGSVR